MPIEIRIGLAALGTMVAIALYRFALSRPQALRDRQRAQEEERRREAPFQLKADALAREERKVEEKYEKEEITKEQLRRRQKRLHRAKQDLYERREDARQQWEAEKEQRYVHVGGLGGHLQDGQDRRVDRYCPCSTASTAYLVHPVSGPLWQR